MTIALIGPNANDSIMQWGNYNGFPSHTTTLYEALKQRIPADRLIYDLGCDRTNDSSLESVFGQCSIDGKPGFKSTYWNNIKMEGKPATITYTNTPFHFTTLGATVFAAGVNIQDFRHAMSQLLLHSRQKILIFISKQKGPSASA